MYHKGDKTLVITNDSLGIKTSSYYTNDKCDIFFETPEGKKAKLNTNATTMNLSIINYADVKNNWSRFLASLHTKIEEVTLNGKECYHITGDLESKFIYANMEEKEWKKNMNLAMYQIKFL